MMHGSKNRLDVLRRLLADGELSTQEELRDKLQKKEFEVTQSTVSRDLRKLGAIRAIDTDGRNIYRLPDEFEAPRAAQSPATLVKEIRTNGNLIVILTAVGSANLIARYLDKMRPAGILGTLAGDDTIFVAPASTNPKEIKETIQAIYSALIPG